MEVPGFCQAYRIILCRSLQQAPVLLLHSSSRSAKPSRCCVIVCMAMVAAPKKCGIAFINMGNIIYLGYQKNLDNIYWFINLLTWKVIQVLYIPGHSWAVTLDLSWCPPVCHSLRVNSADIVTTTAVGFSVAWWKSKGQMVWLYKSPVLATFLCMFSLLPHGLCQYFNDTAFGLDFSLMFSGVHWQCLQ